MTRFAACGNANGTAFATVVVDVDCLTACVLPHALHASAAVAVRAPHATFLEIRLPIDDVEQPRHGGGGANRDPERITTQLAEIALGIERERVGS